ncbi:M20 metallopeptidase family protein [Enterococcus sp. JM9B]|uniref:M20 metallopeptidase family protein n=1 Tax=Enterococcus sp. JM9B TaxID=1857216 RepID=UPI001374DE50|nr:amidohydrolase [Enterococcus sp. JM9B]KAF1302966.1 amidohydrolase [Enterococcus sp. JM9B]
MIIQPEIQALLPDVTAFRRELHQIPELGLQEFQTIAYLKKQLASFGIQEIHQVLDTALVVVFEGELPGKTIAFRTDIDALPVTEETGASFASKIPGRMHACGHDGHMATMLGFAKYLAEHPEVIQGKILLLFQPAEEGPGGAQLVIDAGVLTKYGVDEIVGLHLFPEFDEGRIACRKGGMMARNGEVTLTITGQSAHGAQPQQGADAILAAAAVIQGVHSIISRNLSPLDSAVLTFGDIQGGEAMNIIAGKVVIHGTMRAFSDTVYDTMVERITRLTTEIAQGYGCRGEVFFNHMYRVVDNDPQMVENLEKIAGDSYVESPPYLLAEDFSMYQQEIPGLFFFVGTRNEEKGYTYPLHSGKMQFDEKNLLGGIQCYLQLIEALNN